MSISHKSQYLDMSIQATEKYKDDFERSELLAKTKAKTIQKRCHQAGCRNHQKLRCKACRASYCSRRCQKLEWHCHIFIYTVTGRPNLVDSFIFLIRNVKNAQTVDDQNTMLRKQILDDSDMSKAFVFDSCETLVEFNNLICIYE